MSDAGAGRQAALSGVVSLCTSNTINKVLQYSTVLRQYTRARHRGWDGDVVGEMCVVVKNKTNTVLKIRELTGDELRSNSLSLSAVLSLPRCF